LESEKVTLAPCGLERHFFGYELLCLRIPLLIYVHHSDTQYNND